MGHNWNEKKMFIGVCDDDKEWCECAAKIIQNFADKIQMEVELFFFHNGQEFLDYRGQPIDLLFLDIEISDMNGIELAKKVNIQWPGCQIVFLTNYLYYAVEIFETKHVYYVLKGEFEVRLPEVFNKVMHIMEQNGKKIVFKVVKGKEIIVRPEDILYIERELRHTIVHTSWGDFRVREKIDDLIERFSEIDFSRCHHSYIVHFPAVREKTREAYIMENGVEIAISRGYSKDTNDKWMRWALLQMS